MLTSISSSKWPMLQTMDWSRIFSMCSMRMIRQLPVAVTKMLASLSASSTVVTSISFHGSLQCADGIDLSDQHPGTESAHGLRAALADISVAAHAHHLACHHHVRCALDAVCKRFPATVEVVELALGNRVVHIDGREEERLRSPSSGKAGERRWWSLRIRPSSPSPSGARTSGPLQPLLRVALMMASSLIRRGLHPEWMDLLRPGIPGESRVSRLRRHPR